MYRFHRLAGLLMILWGSLVGSFLTFHRPQTTSLGTAHVVDYTPETVSSMTNVPKHVAYIVDGNGRWAVDRNLPRSAGHVHGARTTVDIVNCTFALGVEHITLYLFSTENWKRPESEIGNIMALLQEYLIKYSSFFQDNRIELQAIGQLELLPPGIKQLIDTVGYHGRRNFHWESDKSPTLATKRVLTLALSYGGRHDIVQTARTLALEVSRGNLKLEDITESTFGKHTQTGLLNVPDPDLIIRTSGEHRLSNFLLWQSAYSELSTTKTLCKLCIIY